MSDPSLMRTETRARARISGPLLFLERTTDLPYGAMVDITASDGSRRSGQVIEVSEELAVVQVFEDTMGLDVAGTSVSLREREARLGVSEELIGRVMDGAGRPLDGLPPVLALEKRPIAGTPMNPVSRDKPRDFVQTGAFRNRRVQHAGARPEAAHLLRGGASRERDCRPDPSPVARPRGAGEIRHGVCRHRHHAA